MGEQMLINKLCKMNSNKDIHLLTKVAVLHFENHLSHQEIAHRLGLSRQTVGRLLQRSRDLGIVRIEIVSPLFYASELETKLEQAFQLLEVVVVTPPTESDEAIKRTVGQAGAEFLQRRVRNGDTIGVSAGSTAIYECAIRLQPAHLPDLTVVSLNGNGPRSQVPTNIKSIADQIGRTLGGKTVVLPAPTYVDRNDIKQSLLSDSNIAEIIELANRANIAVVGIGQISGRIDSLPAWFY